MSCKDCIFLSVEDKWQGYFFCSYRSIAGTWFIKDQTLCSGCGAYIHFSKWRDDFNGYSTRSYRARDVFSKTPYEELSARRC